MKHCITAGCKTRRLCSTSLEQPSRSQVHSSHHWEKSTTLAECLVAVPWLLVLGRTQPEEAARSHLPMGPPFVRRKFKVRYNVRWAAGKCGGLGMPTHGELVCKAEWYKLHRQH